MAALVRVWPVFLVFVTVVGGIYGGIFTPTEGAAVGAFGTGLLAWLNGGLTRATLADSFFTTAKSTAMIFFIVLGAAFYNGFLALSQVPQEVAAWVVDQGFSPWIVLVLILVFYLLLGCLMDSLSMILLTIPIFWPVIQGLDFGMVSMAELHAARALEALAKGAALAPDVLDSIHTALAQGAELTRDQIKALGLRGVNAGALARINTEQTAIWFGILVLIVVEVGLITPPVGMNLFIINTMDRKTPMIETYRAVVFFVASDIVRVAILVGFPAITLFLVGW
jgi:TRAP-type C4-dicarboxylate transport system permease large subunit